MGDLSLCPYCNGFMQYVYSDDSLICDTCCYTINGDGNVDLSNMDYDELENDKLGIS